MKFAFSAEEILEGQIFLVNKPLTWTSFDVVNKIRYALKKRFQLKKIKVGHAGTLDPLATGLLIICVGKATKQIDNLTIKNKTYTGSFFIGATRPSYDKETEIEKTFLIETITNEQIIDAANNLTGKLKQIPPIFSAKRVDGKRAYEAARSGKEMELKPNDVEVFKFNVTKIEKPLVYFEIECSKGTYIRSLARDFGEQLNNGAYLASLCRTKVGDFSLDNAFELDDLILSIHEGID